MKIPKLKKKSFLIDLQIYPYTIFVVFVSPLTLYDAFKQYQYPVKKENIEIIIKQLIEKENIAGYSMQLENGNVVLYFPYSDFKLCNSYMFNTITHEVLHATEMIMNRIGLNLKSENDEAFCYLNGYINQKIFEQI